MGFLKDQNKEFFLVLSVVIFGGIIRIVFLRSDSLWYDETFTVLISRQSWDDLQVFLLADGVHPPLFYWLSKIWIDFFGDDNEFIIRLPAVLAGTASIAGIYILSKKFTGKTEALLAALLLTLSSYHVWYSREARMYSILGMIAIIVMYLYAKIYEGASFRDKLFFIVASSIAYGLHYFAFFLPLIQFIHLAIHLKKKPLILRQWVLLQALSAIPFVFWVLALAQIEGRSFGIGWIEPPILRDLLFTLINFTVGFESSMGPFQWVGLVIIIVSLGLSFRTNWERPELKVLTILWGFFPMVFTFLISFRRPTYVDRYFIISLPAFILLLSVGFVSWINGNKGKCNTSIHNICKRGGVLALSLMVVVMSFGVFRFNFSSGKLVKEQWREAAEFLNRSAWHEDVIVLRTLQLYVPFTYYTIEVAPIRVIEENRVIHPLDELVRDADRIWLVYKGFSFSAHRYIQHDDFNLTSENLTELRTMILEQDPCFESGRVDFEGVTIFCVEN